jgi:hypothetical protein
MLPIWKAAAPAIDAIGPDLYSNNREFALDILDIYARFDNPLWIPETGRGDDFAPYLFAALERGAIGYSPFGIDWTDHPPAGTVPRAHAANFALLGPMDRTLAQLTYAGKVKAFIEPAGGVDQEKLFTADPETHPNTVTSKGDSSELESALISPIRLANATVSFETAGTPATRAADASGAWVADVRFGFPQRDGQPTPGSVNKEGRILVAQLGPNEYLLTGIGGAVFFHRPGFLPGIRMQILTAEEGYYTPGSSPGAPEIWHVTRILNGDETDRGIRFPDPSASSTNRDANTPVSGDSAAVAISPSGPMAVRVTLGRF